MKTTPYFQCPNCKRTLELGVEDLAFIDRDRRQHRLADQPAKPDCPCKYRLYVHPKLANDIIIAIQAEENPEPEIVEQAEVSEPGVAEAEPVEEPPSPPAPARGKTEEQKLEEAVAAKKAVETHGTQAKAAEALGVSVQTVRNRLKYLDTLGTVPGDDE